MESGVPVTSFTLRNGGRALAGCGERGFVSQRGARLHGDLLF